MTHNQNRVASAAAAFLSGRQFFLFLLCGGLAALVNMGGRWALNHVFSYPLSICLGYLLGMVVAFFLFKSLVFKAGRSRRTLREGLLFTAVNVLALAQTLLVSLLLASWLFPRLRFDFYPEDCAHVVGVIVPVFSSFIGHKYFTFRSASA